MLRLDMEDTNGTVLFVDPMKGVKILKEYGMNPQIFIEAGYSFSHAVYDSEENRDAAYERVLNKINEYLFPQIESTMVTGERTDLDDLFNPSSVGHL